MADQQQLQLIRRSVSEWKQWRTENPDAVPDLTEADLSGAQLFEADLAGAHVTNANLSTANLERARLTGANLGLANLREANLRGADLSKADLRGADLGKAKLSKAHLLGVHYIEVDLSQADLTGANLREADLSGAYLAEADLRLADLRGADLSRTHLGEADLRGANLGWANLRGADLSQVALIRTNLEHAILTDAKVYGVSVWDANLGNALQDNLVITQLEPAITVDNLEVAQFIYLLLNNSKLRNVLDTITSKAVLILGRFTPERKITLDTLRNALRNHNYLPILFDFEKPANRDFTETVSTLAHLSRFVIADLTDPRSVPQELMAIIPRLLSVPVRPLLLGSQSEWGMFSDLKRFPQVIRPLHYSNDDMLLSCLETDVIAPAEQRVRELSTK